MRSKESNLLLSLTDTEVIALKKEQAKEDLKWDLIEALNLEIDSSDMESYLTDNESFLQELLANRQLFWYFMEELGQQGSLNNEKAAFYKRSYEEKRLKLKSLFNNDLIPSKKQVSLYR